MRIFVTGATGVIGRRVVPVLLRNGHQVTAAGRSLSRVQTLEHIGAAVVALQESFVTYPDFGDRWVTEEVSPDPPSYNRTVLDAEASALRFATEGGRGVVLRFAYFYGPNDDFTATLLASVRRGWLPLPGQPQGYFSLSWLAISAFRRRDSYRPGLPT